MDLTVRFVRKDQPEMVELYERKKKINSLATDDSYIFPIITGRQLSDSKSRTNYGVIFLGIMDWKLKYQVCTTILQGCTI